MHEYSVHTHTEGAPVATAVTTYQKDSDAILDYAFDWTLWLSESEEITTSEIIASPGIVVESDSNTVAKATVWLSGGTAGQPYTVTNRITTNQGRTDDRTITIRVVNR